MNGKTIGIAALVLAVLAVIGLVVGGVIKPSPVPTPCNVCTPVPTRTLVAHPTATQTHVYPTEVPTAPMPVPSEVPSVQPTVPAPIPTDVPTAVPTAPGPIPTAQVYLMETWFTVPFVQPPTAHIAA